MTLIIFKSINNLKLNSNRSTRFVTPASSFTPKEKNRPQRFHPFTSFFSQFASSAPHLRVPSNVYRAGSSNSHKTYHSSRPAAQDILCMRDRQSDHEWYLDDWRYSRSTGSDCNRQTSTFGLTVPEWPSDHPDNEGISGYPGCFCLPRFPSHTELVAPWSILGQTSTCGHPVSAHTSYVSSASTPHRTDGVLPQIPTLLVSEGRMTITGHPWPCSGIHSYCLLY